MNYKLNFVRVFVTDWNRALRFYTETLGIPVTYQDETMGWASLDTGVATLAIERAAGEPSLVGRYLGVSLFVDDIHATHRTLVERGVEFVEPPEKQHWGGILAEFRDPDGNVVTLVGRE